MTAPSRIVSRLRSLTLIQCLAVAAVVTAIAALVSPATEWASSGSIRIPVRVVIFDAAKGDPIAGAAVAVFRALPAEGQADIPEPMSEDFMTSRNLRGRAVTGHDGTAVVDIEFRTGASRESPTPKAHLRWEWVVASAEDYGTTMVPVRYEPVPTKTLRDQKQLLAVVGLTRIHQGN